MDLSIFLSAVEVLCINIITFELCCRRKYSRSVTAAVLAVSTAVIYLGIAAFFDMTGDGKLMVFGFLFLVPYVFLYKEKISRLLLVMCMCWTYTISISFFSIQISRLLSYEHRTVIALVFQSAVFLGTLYPFYKKGVPKYMFILQTLRKYDAGCGRYFNFSCFLHFIMLTVLHMIFLEEPGNWSKIAAYVLLIGITYLSYQMIYRMISDSARIQELERISEYDALTGIANRTKLFADLEHMRRGKREFSILFIDLNRFKEINDTYGHIIGDQYLKHFAEICAEIFRGYGQAYRYGGDEFVVICQGSIPQQLIEEVRTCPAWEKGAPCPYNSASIGKIMCSPPFPDADELLNQVDRKMYEMKTKTRKEA